MILIAVIALHSVAHHDALIDGNDALGERVDQLLFVRDHENRRAQLVDLLQQQHQIEAAHRVEIAGMPAALTGALIAYLFYNWHPAKVFMGDTGSLFLGGAVCAIAFALDIPLVLMLVGIVYIVETLSVILQVAYFKLTHGKRLFKMSPIHHHYEMCGWKEEKICIVFTTVCVIACLIAWFGISGRIG